MTRTDEKQKTLTLHLQNLHPTNSNSDEKQQVNEEDEFPCVSRHTSPFTISFLMLTRVPQCRRASRAPAIMLRATGHQCSETDQGRQREEAAMQAGGRWGYGQRRAPAWYPGQGA